MSVKSYRVRTADGGEVEVGSPADAKRLYPDGAILYYTELDAVGNPQQRAYHGHQPQPPAEEAAPTEVKAAPAKESPKVDAKPAKEAKS